MFIKLIFFALLGCGWLQGMEKGTKERESFLQVLSPDLRNELRKYAMQFQTKLDLLPPDLQKELMKFFFVSTPKELSRMSMSDFKDVITQVRPLFFHEFALKEIFPIIERSGGRSVMDAIRFAAALNVPTVTVWLKKYIADQGNLGKAIAGEMALDVIKELGYLRQQSFDKPLSEKQKELEEFLEATLNTLLSLGIDVNQKDLMSGLTSFQQAVVHGDLSTVNLLIKHGAQTDIKNKDGQTLIDRAKSEQKRAATEQKLELEKAYEQIINLLARQPGADK